MDTPNPGSRFPRRDGLDVPQRRRPIPMGQRVRAPEHAKGSQLHFRMAGGFGLAGFHRVVSLSDG